MPCWGYVFNEPTVPVAGPGGLVRPGRKVVLLGDTCDSTAIAPLARGCDLISHEATFNRGEGAGEGHLWFKKKRGVGACMLIFIPLRPVALAETLPLLPLLHCTHARVSASFLSPLPRTHTCTLAPCVTGMEEKARIATHSTAEQAGAFAGSIRARNLVLTHFSARYEQNRWLAQRERHVKERGSELNSSVAAGLMEEARGLAGGAKVWLANDFYTFTVGPRQPVSAQAAAESEAAHVGGGGSRLSGGQRGGPREGQFVAARRQGQQGARREQR